MTIFRSKWLERTLAGATNPTDKTDKSPVSGPGGAKKCTDKTDKTPFVGFVGSLSDPRGEIRGATQVDPSEQADAQARAAGLEVQQELARYKQEGWIAIYSEVLGETIILARDEEAAKVAPAGFVTYTEAEVALLLTATPDELRQVHKAKRLLGGRIQERAGATNPTDKTDKSP